VTAPTKWRDALQREWVLAEFGLLQQAAPGAAREKFGRSVVEHLCGPLVPVEPMARVHVRNGYGYAYTDEPLGYVVKGRDAKAATTYSLARAEEIASAFRTLGYAYASVEVVA
jgi:hypothetical protein